MLFVFLKFELLVTVTVVACLHLQYFTLNVQLFSVFCLFVFCCFLYLSPRFIIGWHSVFIEIFISSGGGVRVDLLYSVNRPLACPSG